MNKQPKRLICKNCKIPMQWNIPHICKIDSNKDERQGEDCMLHYYAGLKEGKSSAIKEVLEIIDEEVFCSLQNDKNHNTKECLLCSLRYVLKQKLQEKTAK